MDYFITSTKGNDKKILSRHSSYEDALASGELAFKEAKHDEVISCIQAELDADGKIKGKYRLFETWI